MKYIFSSDTPHPKKMITTERSTAEFMEQIKLLQEEIQRLYLTGDRFAVGWSGGKDSTAALQLIWKAVLGLPVEERIHDIEVITNDTLVENPIVSAQVKNSIKRMEAAAKKQQMPIKTHITHPSVENTFWVKLIGNGYPAPRWGFRWCTERLKINPAEELLRRIVAKNQQIVLVLGVRSAESAARATSMENQRKFQISERLNANPISSGSQTYSPIRDWSTREVWQYLMQFPSPWGDNKELFAMYRGATADSECPMVVDTSTPSCGSSRFGCFVCTMVDQDKSMKAMIQNDEEKEWMQPLLDIRNELDIRDEDGHHADHDRRERRRATGKVQLYEAKADDGSTYLKPIPGPYTRFWREHWLRRVLQAQTQVRKTAPHEMRDITLITPEELSEIRHIWVHEKHEFNDSLPRIYEEVTGYPFEDVRPTGTAILGADEWDTLEQSCNETGASLELMARLLGIESKYNNKVRRARIGIYDELGKCLETYGRSIEGAIANAHHERKLKHEVEALKNGSISSLDKIKKLLDEDDSDESLNPDLEPIEANKEDPTSNLKVIKDKSLLVMDNPESFMPDIEQVLVNEEDSISSLETIKKMLTEVVTDDRPKQMSWADLKFTPQK